MSKHRDRFIPNSIDFSKISIKGTLSELEKRIQDLEKESKVFFPPNSVKTIDSINRKKTDTSFYTGTGGLIYLYWRQFLHYKTAESLNNFKVAIETNLSIINQTGREKSSNSFFEGNAGIFTLGCVCSLYTNNKKEFDAYFNELMNLRDISYGKTCELEILYGCAGYLYSLLLLKKEVVTSKTQLVSMEQLIILDDEIKNLSLHLIKSGRIHQQKYSWEHSLLFPFSVQDNYPSFYLGAAHGLIGVLYLILCTIKFFPDFCQRYSDNVLDIRQTLFANLKYIQSLQLSSTGNFPSHVAGDDGAQTVQFCHGAVGAVHLFILAKEIFGDFSFGKTALGCAKCLWERGILLKGNGVCHGMSGVTYGLIKLYKYTKDESLLLKALGILRCTWDPKIREIVSKVKDPQRYTIGLPDRPYSLMEGEAGDLCLCYDLHRYISDVIVNKIDDDKDNLIVVFPGYEIF